MRAIMARLRGASVSSILLHGLPNVAPAVAEPEPMAFEDTGDWIRFAHTEGWLACESRLASPDMADRIAQAIHDPGSILARNTDESIPCWSVRAVQHAVAYGTTTQPQRETTV